MKKFTIRSPHNLAEARQLLEKIASVYQTHRDHRVPAFRSMPQQLIVIETNGKIAGTVGIFLEPDKRTNLYPTEDYFGIDLRSEFERASLCEFGRMVNFQTDVWMLKVFAAALSDFCYREQKRAALSCTKPRLFRMILKSGLPAEQLQGVVQRERIPPEYSGFFLEEPPPVPFLFREGEQTRAVARIHADRIQFPDRYVPTRDLD